jgi:tetratricopeptide (TPR) repeat protein
MYFKCKKTIYIALLSVSWAACRNDAPKEQATSDSMLDNPVVQELSDQIVQSPKDASLYALRGGAYYELEAFDQAAVDYQKAIQLDSTNLEYFHLLADAYSKNGEEELSLKALEGAARLVPKHVPTLLKLTDTYLLLGQHDAAMSTAERAVKLAPKNADAWYLIGLNQQEAGDTTASIAAYKKAFALDDQYVDALIGLGGMLGNTDTKQALAYYDKALALDSTNVDVLYAKADFLHYKQRHFKEAIKWYRKIAQIDYHESRAYLESGIAYLELDDPKMAKGEFGLAIHNDPTYIEAYYFRGLSEEKLGNNKAAIADYEQVLRLKPDYGEAQAALERLKGGG